MLIIGFSTWQVPAYLLYYWIWLKECLLANDVCIIIIWLDGSLEILDWSSCMCVILELTCYGLLTWTGIMHCACDADSSETSDYSFSSFEDVVSSTFILSGLSCFLDSCFFRFLFGSFWPFTYLFNIDSTDSPLCSVCVAGIEVLLLLLWLCPQYVYPHSKPLCLEMKSYHTKSMWE